MDITKVKPQTLEERMLFARFKASVLITGLFSPETNELRQNLGQIVDRRTFQWKYPKRAEYVEHQYAVSKSIADITTKNDKD